MKGPLHAVTSKATAKSRCVLRSNWKPEARIPSAFASDKSEGRPWQPRSFSPGTAPAWQPGTSAWPERPQPALGREQQRRAARTEGLGPGAAAAAPPPHPPLPSPPRLLRARAAHPPPGAPGRRSPCRCRLLMLVACAPGRAPSTTSSSGSSRAAVRLLGGPAAVGLLGGPAAPPATQSRGLAPRSPPPPARFPACRGLLTRLRPAERHRWRLSPRCRPGRAREPRRRAARPRHKPGCPRARSPGGWEAARAAAGGISPTWAQGPVMPGAAASRHLPRCPAPRRMEKPQPRPPQSSAFGGAQVGRAPGKLACSPADPQRPGALPEKATWGLLTATAALGRKESQKASMFTSTGTRRQFTIDMLKE